MSSEAVGLALRVLQAYETTHAAQRCFPSLEQAGLGLAAHPAVVMAAQSANAFETSEARVKSQQLKEDPGTCNDNTSQEQESDSDRELPHLETRFSVRVRIRSTPYSSSSRSFEPPVTHFRNLHRAAAAGQLAEGCQARGETVEAGRESSVDRALAGHIEQRYICGEPWSAQRGALARQPLCCSQDGEAASTDVVWSGCAGTKRIPPFGQGRAPTGRPRMSSVNYLRRGQPQSCASRRLAGHCVCHVPLSGQCPPSLPTLHDPTLP